MVNLQMIFRIAAHPIHPMAQFQDPGSSFPCCGKVFALLVHLGEQVH